MSHSRLGLADGWGQLQNMRFNQDRSAFVCAFQVSLSSLSGIFVQPFRYLCQAFQVSLFSLSGILV